MCCTSAVFPARSWVPVLDVHGDGLELAADALACLRPITLSSSGTSATFDHGPHMAKV
jgi:hypothetical protein